MKTARGHDFADDLTDVERRQLDVLLALVASQPPHLTIDTSVPGVPGAAAISRRRRLSSGKWRSTVVTGLVAAGVLIAAGSVPLLFNQVREDRLPNDPAVTEQRSVAEILDDLAGIAGQITPPPAGGSVLHRYVVDVLVSGGPDSCAVTAVAQHAWVDPTARADWTAGSAIPGYLRTGLTEPPTDAAGRAGCGVVAATTPGSSEPLFDGLTNDLAATSREMAVRTGVDGHHSSPVWATVVFQASAPSIGAPGTARGLELRLGKLCLGVDAERCDALRWAVLVELLTSPQTTPAQRSAALSIGATGGTATLVHDVESDVVGRPGITLRVPYVVLATDSLDTVGPIMTADLTFDPRTGELLQRAIPAGGPASTVLTVYVAATRVPTMP